MFIQFTVNIIRKHLSVYVWPFAFGFEGEMWNLIVLIPEHCL